MKLPMTLAACVAALACTSAASATTINFTALTPGTAVTTQYSGLSFSLIGGPGTDGAPTTGYAWYDTTSSLANSDVTGTIAGAAHGSTGYPTANILNIAFGNGVSGLSFTFNNNGNGQTTYDAYGAGGVLISSGDLNSVENFALVDVAGSGITDLKINNGTNGTSSYIFGVGELSYTTAVPEPATWAMLILGVAMIGWAARRRREGLALAA